MGLFTRQPKITVWDILKKHQLIHSECGKIRIRITSNTDTFYTVNP